MPFIKNFRHIRPKYTQKQEEILEWIALAHTYAEQETPGSAFHTEIKKKLLKVGSGADKIQFRGLEMQDSHHEKWEEMEIYNLKSSSRGNSLKDRMIFFERCVESVFERFYPETEELPDHLIHVTCTGYVSPSGAQKLVSKRQTPGKQTDVSHAYHMGCYASIPAVRMARGFAEYQSKIDIVHTELCTLHMNPLLHETEHLVVQSLFADGFIGYSVTKDKGPGFEILSLKEQIISDTTHAMEWYCEDWNLRMHIDKTIPVLLARALPDFVKTLMQHKKPFFAIHPGGPKIIEYVAKVLDLEPWQISHSKQVMQEYGNMSSATLPHIWEKMWNDPEVPDGSEVISLAFGPGLTAAGGLFRCYKP